MANMPLVHPTYNENIYNIYLDEIFTNASYRDDWNKFLEDIENSFLLDKSDLAYSIVFGIIAKNVRR